MTLEDGWHPIVADDPEIARLAEAEAQAQAEHNAALARNETLRTGWRQETEQAILEGREVPPAPSLADESTLRSTLRARRDSVKRRRGELLRSRHDELVQRLEVREREILDEAARLLPRLRAHADEITLLMRTLHHVGGEGSGAPLPRRIDVDELLHVAGAERPLSFLDGYVRQRTVWST